MPKIVSERIDVADLSGTPNKVLRDILDVDSNLPLWVEDKVKQVMRETEGLPAEERGVKLMEELGHLKISDSLTEYFIQSKK